MKSWVISTVRLLSVRMLWRNASTWTPTQGLGLAQKRTEDGGALGSTDLTHRFHNVKLLPVLHLVDLVDIIHWWFVEVDALSVQSFISLESQQRQTAFSQPIAHPNNQRTCQMRSSYLLKLTLLLLGREIKVLVHLGVILLTVLLKLLSLFLQVRWASVREWIWSSSFFNQSNASTTRAEQQQQLKFRFSVKWKAFKLRASKHSALQGSKRFALACGLLQESSSWTMTFYRLVQDATWLGNTLKQQTLKCPEVPTQKISWWLLEHNGKTRIQFLLQPASGWQRRPDTCIAVQLHFYHKHTHISMYAAHTHAHAQKSIKARHLKSSGDQTTES